MKRRILSLLLCVAMLLTLLPQTVLFASAATSGTCGDNLHWSYNSSTYTLTITGSGAMTNWGYDSDVPWCSYCDSIRSVSLPDGLTSIGKFAFGYCTGLTAISIPDSVTSIGDYAFEGCTGLTAIAIPDSVTSIGDYAFEWCTGLTSITVAEGNPVYDSRNNCTAIIETATNTLIAGCKNTVIPDSVTSIGDAAFSGCTGLTAISIPDSVTSIGMGAFYGCSGLTSITIGNGVTSIGGSAFESCTGLTSITIPDSVTSIGDYAFEWCTGLTSITVAEGNPVYDSRNNCTAIIETATNTLIAGCKNTVIPDSVTSIGDAAFSGCTGLTAISIPDSVTSIGGYAFRYCTGLSHVHFLGSKPSIGAYAFSSCASDLTLCYLPETTGWDGYTDYSTEEWNCTVTRNCTSATYTCNTCGEVYTVSGDYHAWSLTETTIAPTCTDEGNGTYTCSKCGATKTDMIEALGHDYVDGICTRCGALPEVEAYTLTDVLESGDQVVIYNPIQGKAIIASAGTSNYYFGAADVTPVDGEIKNPAADTVWTVTKNDDGSYSFSNDNKKMLFYTSGTYYNLDLIDRGYYTYYDGWKLIPANTKLHAYCLNSVGAADACIGWYRTKDSFSAYKNSDLNEVIFGFQFYRYGMVTDCEHTWSEDIENSEAATCTERGAAAYQCDKCGRIRVEVLEPLGHDYQISSDGTQFVCSRCGDSFANLIGSYRRTDSIADGDEIIFTVNGYVMTTTVSNYGFAAVKPEINGDFLTADESYIVLIVEDAGDGTFYLKNKEGKYLQATSNSYGSSCTISFVGTMNTSNGNYYRYELYTQNNVPMLRVSGAAYTASDSQKCTLCFEYYSNSIYPYRLQPTDGAGTCSAYEIAFYAQTCDHDWVPNSDNQAAPTCDEAGVNAYVCSVCGATKTETAEALGHDFVDGICTRCGASMSETVPVYSEVDLNGDKAPNGNRDSETNLGDMITDAMLWYATEKNPGSINDVPAENIIAITNGGGIRAWIHKGDVTKNDIFTVLPFGNTVAVVYVTGAELLEALEASTYCMPEAVGGFPQIAGIHFTINVDKAYDANAEPYPDSTYYGPASINRVTINDVNGKPFDPAATYAVVTNNFCAAGGDTYYAFTAASSQFDTGCTLYAAVMDYITEKLGGVIPAAQYIAPQGRITVRNGYSETLTGVVIPDGADMLKYGHIDIDIPTDEFLETYAYGDTVTVTLEGYGSFDVPVCASYDEVATGEMLLRVVSGKTYLALAINYGQLAVELGIVERAPEGSEHYYAVADGVTFPIEVSFELKEPAGECDHIWVESGETPTPATCNEPGSIEYTCSLCGATKTETVEALGHEWIAGTVVEATCTEAGYTEYTCSKCGATKNDDETAALGHDYVDGICTRCGYDSSTYPAFNDGDCVVIYNPASGTIIGFDEANDMDEETYEYTYWGYSTEAAEVDGKTLKADYYNAGIWYFIDNEDSTFSLLDEYNYDQYEYEYFLYASYGECYAYYFDENACFTPEKVDGGYLFKCADGTYLAVVDGIVFPIDYVEGDARFVFQFATFNSIEDRADGGTDVVCTLPEGENVCDHEWVESNVITAPTCNEPGSIEYTCSLCGATKTETVEALGHEWIAGTVVEATCTEAGYTEYTCSKCGATKNDDETAALGHDYVDGICDRCGYDSRVYILSETAPVAGCDYIIVFKTDDGRYFALDNYEASPSAVTTCTEVFPEDGMLTCSGNCVFTAVKGEYSGKDGIVFMETENTKYLHLNSSRIRVANDLINGIFGFTAAEDVENAFYMTGLVNNKWLAFEEGKFVSVAAEAAAPVYFYAKSSEHVHVDENADGICDTCKGVILKIKTAYLRLNDNINVVYSAVMDDSLKDPYMIFTFNGEDYTVPCSGKDQNGRYLFELTAVKPHMLADTIRAELHATDRNGQDVVIVHDGYSVLKYCQNIKQAYPENEPLLRLIDDLLVYGAAAQNYTGYKKGTLVTDYSEPTHASTFTAPTKTAFSLTGEADPQFAWKGASLTLSNEVAMCFELITPADAAGMTVEVTINGRTTVYNYEDIVTDDSTQCHVAFRGISALEFNDPVTAIIKNNGVPIGQTLTYSVNSYVYSKYNDSSVPYLAELICAVYNYGNSAKSYAGK